MPTRYSQLCRSLASAAGSGSSNAEWKQVLSFGRVSLLKHG